MTAGVVLAIVDQFPEDGDLCRRRVKTEQVSAGEN
jgi:hypothetical protein